MSEKAAETEPAVHCCEVWLCDLCLDGAGGSCNVPGCVLIRKTAPDAPIRDEVTVLPEGSDVYARAAAPEMLAALRAAPLLPSLIAYGDEEKARLMRAWADAYFAWQDGPLADAIAKAEGR